MTKLGNQRQPPVRKSLLVSDFHRPAAGPLQPARTWAVSRAAFGLPGGAWAGHWAAPGAALQPPLPGAKQPRLYSSLILLGHSSALQQLFIESSRSRAELWEAAGCWSLSEVLYPEKMRKGNELSVLASPVPLFRDAFAEGCRVSRSRSHLPALHLCAHAAQQDHCRKTMIPLGVLVATALFIPF